MARLTTSLLAFLCAFGVSGSVSAAMITLNATDRGAYDNTGFHNPAVLNYVVGDPIPADGTERRNFFVFDLSGVSGLIVSAQLALVNPSTGFASPTGAETYGVFDVTTALASLTAGTAGVGGFADLGGGSSYGSYAATAADNSTTIQFSLNGTALADLNTAIGGLFGIGGAITTLDGVDNAEHLFSSSGSGPFETRLILVTQPIVPEPSSLVLFAMAGACLIGVRRRRSAA